MKTTILQLEAHDDIISTRDKMAWSKTPRIVLVWPRRGTILQRKIDLVLLKRRAEQLGAQVALVTRDPQVLPFAHEVGIPVFANTRQAQRRPWVRKPPATTFRRKARPVLTGGTLRKEKAQLAASANPLWQRQGIRLIIFLAGILAVLALAVFFYPTAQVRIDPARTTQTLSLPLRASPEFTAVTTSGDIPARLARLSVQGSAQQPTSGMTPAANTFAGGSVRFTNLTTQVVRLPAGLVVRTLDDPPVGFQLRETVEVPAGVGLTVDADVRAQLPGSAGNVPAGSIAAINAEQGLNVKVTNLEALTGGTERLSRSPSAADLNELRSTLLASLRNQALEQFQHTVTEGEQVLLESVLVANTVSEKAAPQVSQPGDLLTLQMTVEFQALVVNSADIEQVARAGLDANLPKGFRPLAGTLSIQPGDTMALETDGKALRWQVRAERAVEAGWSEEVVIQKVLGRSLPDAAAELQRSLALQSAPQIQISPSFWRRLPFLPFRITVVTQ